MKVHWFLLLVRRWAAMYSSLAAAELPRPMEVNNYFDPWLACCNCGYTAAKRGEQRTMLRLQRALHGQGVNRMQGQAMHVRPVRQLSGFRQPRHGDTRGNGGGAGHHRRGTTDGIPQAGCHIAEDGALIFCWPWILCS